MPSKGNTWKTSSLKLKPKMSQMNEEAKRLTVVSVLQGKKNIKEEFSAFFSDTSFTAIARIYKAQSIFKRLAWTILVLGMMFWLGVQCYWLLNKYFSYPIEVKLDLKAASHLTFPSVTVCNLNPIRSEYVDKAPYNLLFQYTQEVGVDSLFLATMMNWKFDEFCQTDEYQCSSGQCIKTDFVCDGVYDCNSQDDETNCQTYSCMSNQWKCPLSSTCIPIENICDGVNDCAAREDEDACGVGTCPTGYFMCDSGRCIPSHWICDFITDCPNNEDENQNCTALSSRAPPLMSTTATAPPAKTTMVAGTTTSANPFMTLTTTQSSQSDPSSIPPMTSTDSVKRRKREAGDPNVDKKIHYPRQHEKIKSGKHPRSRWPSKANVELANIRSLMTSMTSRVDEEEFRRKLHASYMAFVDKQVAQRRRSSQKQKGRPNSTKHHIKKRQAYPRSSSSSEENERLSINWTSVLSNSSFSKWDMLDQGINLSSSFYVERDTEYEASMTYAYITAQLDPAVVEKSGHKKKDFIASCRFGGYLCSPINFTYLHNHKYGNCYTFNSPSSEATLETKFPGPEYGLRLDLFIEQTQYVANLATEAGARILVHKRGSMPFPEDEGISVMPGRSTSVGIRQILLSRLPPPYGVCRNEAKRKDYYVDNLGTDYGKLSCLKSCYQDIIMEHCNCAVTFYYVGNNVTVCNMSSPETEKCITDLPKGFPELYRACDNVCPQPCEEVHYDMSISAAKWPSEPYEDHLVRKLGQTNSLYLQTDNSDEEFTRVQIYFQDLIYQHVEQQKAYESMNLISDLGGQLGLWLGLSAITIGELCSLLFSLGRSLPSSWCSRKTKPSESTPVNSIHPATLQEMYEDMYPEAAKYAPPDVVRPSMHSSIND